MVRRCRIRLFVLALGVLGALVTPQWAAAQHEHHEMPLSPQWSWSGHAQAFVEFNYQRRKFRDFATFELPNWMMLVGQRAVGRGRLQVHGMLSAEDYTLPRYGSAQVFQTGETYAGAALIDYQHPHDVIMAAYARYDLPAAGAWRWHLEGGPVGTPALGPVPFMHRASAASNPTAPLGHHHFDSTHITHGVITAGVTRGPVTVAGSAFHGREADEDRLRVEFGPIDSYAARVSWRRGAWDAQLSGGHLKFPDKTEFTDSRRVTGSISYTGTWRARPIAWTFAFGVNNETAFEIISPAWLLEGVWQARTETRLYMRGELIDKDILTHGGYDPPGFSHEHVLSRVGALTVGIDRDVWRTRAGNWSVGGDATAYYRDANLDEQYGYPFSLHVFLRYRIGSPHVR